MSVSLPANSIFICYRRLDAEDVVDRIYSEVAPHFSNGAIFRDVDSIPPGTLFPAYIARCLQGCPVVLVFIGRDWLDARDERGRRRLDDPADHVRIEIETALALPDARVIPVLVRRAEMPAEEQLPESLRSLRLRGGVFIRSTGADYKHDVQLLANVLQRSVKEVLAQRSATIKYASAAPIGTPQNSAAPLVPKQPRGRTAGLKMGMTRLWNTARIVSGAVLMLVGGFFLVVPPCDLSVTRDESGLLVGMGTLGLAVFNVGAWLCQVGPGSGQGRGSQKAWGASFTLLGGIWLIHGFEGKEYSYLAGILGCGLAIGGLLVFFGKLGARRT